MNERAIKLYEEATEFAYKTVGKEHAGKSYFQGVIAGKFAELIVRECVTIINHGIDHTDYPHPDDTEKSMIEMKAQIWCRDAIKEHFGVK